MISANMGKVKTMLDDRQLALLKAGIALGTKCHFLSHYFRVPFSLVAEIATELPLPNTCWRLATRCGADN